MKLYFQRAVVVVVVIAVVVVGDDTYYWVYLSSDHRFQVYCKVRQLIYYKVQQVLLQSATEHPSTYLG